MSVRFKAISQWLESQHALDPGQYRLDEVADDAGFRRYYRLSFSTDNGETETRIIMDAPPELESSREFVDIALRWKKNDLPVPDIYAANLASGFIELEDLGSEHLRKRLRHLAVEEQMPWLEEAMKLNTRIAAQSPIMLPPYDHTRLAYELDLFPEWALNHWLKIEVPTEWAGVRESLLSSILAQPQVTTHRDFHPENLMIDKHENLRVIDFQGAWGGAIGYDPGALLRDRNTPWPIQQQHALYQVHHEAALKAGLTNETSSDKYLSWIDEASAQRSLKVLGLFCRLATLSQKPRYLLNFETCFFAHLCEALNSMIERDIPQANLYSQFLAWLQQTFEPAMLNGLDKLTRHPQEN